MLCFNYIPLGGVQPTPEQSKEIYDQTYGIRQTGGIGSGLGAKSQFMDPKSINIGDLSNNWTDRMELLKNIIVWIQAKYGTDVTSEMNNNKVTEQIIDQGIVYDVTSTNTDIAPRVDWKNNTDSNYFNARGYKIGDTLYIKVRTANGGSNIIQIK